MLNAVGPARLVARLKRAGGQRRRCPTTSAPGLAIGLGGVGVTLRDLVSLYAAIARGGTAVTLRDGVDEPPTPLHRRAGAVAGRGLVRRRHPRRRAAAAQRLARPRSPTRPAPPTAIATPGRSASTARNVVGVWVGRPDGTPVPGLSGIVSAAPILFEAFDRIGPKRVAAQARAARRADRRHRRRRCRRRSAAFRGPGDATFVARDDDPEIAYPLDGVAVDLGIADGDPAPLIIKVRNGAPPFTFFVNGAPIARAALRPLRDLAAGRPGLRHAVGGRPRRQVRPGDGAGGVRLRRNDRLSAPP